MIKTKKIYYAACSECFKKITDYCAGVTKKEFNLELKACGWIVGKKNNLCLSCLRKNKITSKKEVDAHLPPDEEHHIPLGE